MERATEAPRALGLNFSSLKALECSVPAVHCVPCNSPNGRNLDSVRARRYYRDEWNWIVFLDRHDSLRIRTLNTLGYSVEEVHRQREGPLRSEASHLNLASGAWHGTCCMYSQIFTLRSYSGWYHLPLRSKLRLTSTSAFSSTDEDLFQGSNSVGACSNYEVLPSPEACS